VPFILCLAGQHSSGDTSPTPQDPPSPFEWLLRGWSRALVRADGQCSRARPFRIGRRPAERSDIRASSSRCRRHLAAPCWASLAFSFFRRGDFHCQGNRGVFLERLLGLPLATSGGGGGASASQAGLRSRLSFQPPFNFGNRGAPRPSHLRAQSPQHRSHQPLRTESQ